MEDAMKHVPCLLAIALALSLPAASIARNDTVHMTVAAIAYHNLDGGVKTAVDATLKDHPQYGAWTAAYSQEKPLVPLGEYVFEKAAAWPDAIRHKVSPFDHPNWHFIDYPVALDATDAEVTPDAEPENNILTGFKAAEDAVQSSASTAENKAAHLSWVLHLVSHLHEPLHCATLKNARYPNTDRGGTIFFVNSGTRTQSLHSYWDDQLGKSTTPDNAEALASALVKDNPRAKFPQLTAHRTPMSWSLESRDIAISGVYKDLVPPGEAKPETTTMELPDGYADKAEKIAKQQTAIAGYRLADELNRLMKPIARATTP